MTRTIEERKTRIAAAVARGKREILADIEAGIVPPSVSNFGELHDYRDANTYAGLCDEGENDWWSWYGISIDDELLDRHGPDWEAHWADTNEVQDWLNEWLENGRKED